LETFRLSVAGSAIEFIINQIKLKNIIKTMTDQNSIQELVNQPIENIFIVENLRVAYPSRENQTNWAVDQVSFALKPGERLGLVGESGCGKSTIGRATMRLLPEKTQVEGQVIFAGQSVLEMNKEQLRKFRGEAVALVFQDPMTRLDPLMTIGEHCLETLQAHQPNLSKKVAKEKALTILESVKIPASRWSQYPHEFSGGMRQRVAIALALLLSPKLIVADEPTTSLDVTVANQILQELTRLCAERGTALLLISHDLAMISKYCDRLGVMYQGKMVETGLTKEVFKNPQHEYTQLLLEASLHTKRDGDIVVNNQPQNEIKPLLKLENLQQYYSLESGLIGQLFRQEKQLIKAVDNITLDIYEGETLGLVGESGCGKSTLSRTILQLIPATGGKVLFQGAELTNLSRQAVRPYRRQMQMVFQDPHACLNPMMTVGESIADPLLIHKLATPDQTRPQVIKMLERVGLHPAAEYADRYPSELSGGQQQRVAIARALITHPQLLICDEPVSMLDASIQKQVLELMQALKDEFQLTYLFITHDLLVARFFCDRIAVMNQGKIVELGKTENIFTNPQNQYTQNLLQAVI
jgi:peptide/nickel transport system ATP-binding protein